MRSSVGSERMVPMDLHILGQYMSNLMLCVVMGQLYSQLGRAFPMWGMVRCVVIFLMVVARVMVVNFFWVESLNPACGGKAPAILVPAICTRGGLLSVGVGVGGCHRRRLSRSRCRSLPHAIVWLVLLRSDLGR